MKLLTDKKGVNDISIITGIVLVFVLLGAFLPFVNAEFGITTGGVANIDGLTEDIGQKADNVSTINAFDVLFSVLKMFFWTFGALPLFIELIISVFRIILVVTIARNIWIGGGG